MSEEQGQDVPKNISMEDLAAMMMQGNQHQPISEELKEKHKEVIASVMEIQKPMVTMQVENHSKMSDLFKNAAIPEEEFDQIISHCEHELNELYHEKMNAIYGNPAQPEG